MKLQQFTEAFTLLKEQKRLCITGAIGTGKLYQAKKLAAQLNATIIVKSMHAQLSYEDFIYGYEVQVLEDESVAFVEKEKSLLRVLIDADQSEDPVVLILKDINLINLHQTFGEAISLLKGAKTVQLNNGLMYNVPNNLFIIATLNPLYDNGTSMTTDILNHFCTIEITSADDEVQLEAFQEKYGDHPMLQPAFEKATEYFKRINKEIIKNNLNKQLLNPSMYHIGSSFFIEMNLEARLQHQIIPLLYQWVSDDILTKHALTELGRIESMPQYTNDHLLVTDYRLHIEDKERKGTNLVPLNERFTKYLHDMWESGESQEGLSNPLAPHILLTHLLQLRYISVREVFYQIMYSEKFFKLHETVLEKGYLYLKKPKIKDNNSVYRLSDGQIKINDQTFCIFRSFPYHDSKLKLKDDLLDECETNKKHVNINNTMYVMLKKFYSLYIHNLSQLEGKENRRLYQYAVNEWARFEQAIKQIIEQYDKSSYYGDPALEQKRKSMYYILLNEIQSLTLLYAKLGDELQDEDGQKIVVKGAYKMAQKDYLGIVESLGVNQIILQGPPGTSKTFSAKDMIKSAIAGANTTDEMLAKSRFASEAIDYPYDVAWNIVQFHPSYTYEDFVRGIQVDTPEGKDQPSYKTVNKILGEMAAQATNHPNVKYYLIVDEINRANLATVFGELIYGLEYRDESVATPYRIGDSYNIQLPKNLYIIGTMNTADKSVGSIDYAIRRRFLFFDVLPSVAVLNQLIEEEKVVAQAAPLFTKLAEFFERHTSKDYNVRDVQIGHTYFIAKSKTLLNQRFEYQIVPIIKEYYKDGIIQYSNNEDEFASFFQLLKGENNVTAHDVFDEWLAVSASVEA